MKAGEIRITSEDDEAWYAVRADGRKLTITKTSILSEIVPILEKLYASSNAKQTNNRTKESKSIF